MNLGCRANARAMPIRWRCPPENRAGSGWRSYCGSAHLVEQFVDALALLGLLFATAPPRGSPMMEATVMRRGFRLAWGPGNTICMVGRTLCVGFSGASSVMVPVDNHVTFGGSYKRSSARPQVLLPQPTHPPGLWSRLRQCQSHAIHCSALRRCAAAAGRNRWESRTLRLRTPAPWLACWSQLSHGAPSRLGIPEAGDIVPGSNGSGVGISRAQRPSATVQRGRNAHAGGSALRMGGWPDHIELGARGPFQTRHGLEQAPGGGAGCSKQLVHRCHFHDLATIHHHGAVDDVMPATTPRSW